MELTFWLSIGFVAYVYVGYAGVLALWARVRARGQRARAEPGRVPALPGVTIVVAAHNEGVRLGARLENLLLLDYPQTLREIIVVSDGSTDDTAAVVRRYASSVELVVVPRGGKALALNAGVERARFDIIVFADARQTFARDALRQLVAPFSDPAVGGVTGELLLDCESALFANRRVTADRRQGQAAGVPPRQRRTNLDRRSAAQSSIGDGVGLYWRYEKYLRRLESAIASTLGATGAIYAIRRALWTPLPADTILDDVLTPMRVVMEGYRVVFEEGAHAYDRAPADADAELRRKVRTLAGNFQILWLEPRLLAPWRNPVWFQYVSHKIGRLLAPYALLAAFFATVALASRSYVYLAILVAEVAFLGLAGYGALLEYRVRMPSPLPGVPARDSA